MDLLGHVQVAAELRFQHAVVVAKLLLLGQAHAVFGVAPAAIAVHAGQLEFLGGVLGDVGNGNADATGELDLRTEITAHGGTSLSQNRRGVATEVSTSYNAFARDSHGSEACVAIPFDSGSTPIRFTSERGGGLYLTPSPWQPVDFVDLRLVFAVIQIPH